MVPDTPFVELFELAGDVYRPVGSATGRNVLQVVLHEVSVPLCPADLVAPPARA